MCLVRNTMLTFCGVDLFSMLSAQMDREDVGRRDTVMEGWKGAMRKARHLILRLGMCWVGVGGLSNTHLLSIRGGGLPLLQWDIGFRALFYGLGSLFCPCCFPPCRASWWHYHTKAFGFSSQESLIKSDP